MPFEPRVMNQVEESDLSKQAILYYLDRAQATPSHDFDHAYKVALTAMESAYESGIRAREPLQDLFLAGLFHDFIRSSENVTDHDGVQQSLKEFDSFCQNQLSSFDSRRKNRIKRMITDPINSPVGVHLEYADCVHVLKFNRLQAFSREHPKLRIKPVAVTRSAFERKFEEKVAHLPTAFQKKLDQLAVSLKGKLKTTPRPAYLLAHDAFGVPARQEPLTPTELFEHATFQRFHESLDSLSMLVLHHAKTDPAFAAQVMNRISHESFWSQYATPKNPRPFSGSARVKLEALTKLVSQPQRVRIIRVPSLLRQKNELAPSNRNAVRPFRMDKKRSPVK